MPNDIEKATVNLRTFIIAVLAVASFSISGTLTYMSLAYANKEIVYTNDRIDKKTARNQERVEALEERVLILEKEMLKD